MRFSTFRLAGRARLLASAVAAAALASTMLATGCRGGLPKPGSSDYASFVQTFYVGLAALQVGNDARADAMLEQATKLAPGEPAAWADWGLLALRQRKFEEAKQRIDKAHALDEKNARIASLLGVLESTRGNSAAAISDFRQADALKPGDPQIEESLAQEIERQGGANSEAEVEELTQKIVAEQPNNLAALLDLSRVAAKRGDAATLRSTVSRIAALSAGWPPAAQQQLQELQKAAAGGPPVMAATRSIFLRNVLMQVPSFRRDVAAIHAEAGEEAQPFVSFLKLPQPVSKPAAPDTGLRFVADMVANTPQQKWDWVGAVALSAEDAPVVMTANAKTVKLASGASMAFPGGAHETPPGPESVLPVDFNYDFRTDLVLAGAGGVRFLRQDSPQEFTDVTAQTKLSSAVTNARYTGAWAVDIEADGDMDVVLGGASGEPTVLRNNGDGTFTPVHPFAGVSGVQQLVWADLDDDGNPDVSLIDGAGRLHVFHNERGGVFRETAVPARGAVRAIAAADTRHSGMLDLLALEGDGAIERLANDNGSWTTTELARAPQEALSGDVRLLTGDLDNNGATDLMLAHVGAGSNAGALVWLANAAGHYSMLQPAATAGRVFATADLKNSGHLDLLGLNGDGQPVRFANQGTKSYHWQVIRTRAVQATGDQRINSFGVGGEVEIRSGLLLQAQPITGPETHFGLGEWTETDVARILWPNGTVNAEFELKDDQLVLAQQRLKGSCPFLFAWNGKKMQFVKDTVPWGAAIGLRINGLGPARIAATEEWYKIPRADLVPRDGAYDLAITGELWETYYYDWLQLMTVDHPAGTEVFTDERFVVPAVKRQIIATDEPHAIAHAVDDRGTDVTATVRDLDGRYLDTFGRGQYQGITRDHFVEVDLGEGIPEGGPLYLIARGWVHPSDSSINVAMSQDNHVEPHPLSLEVPDGHGGWVVAKANLGFPAGRKKICLIDLTGVFRPGTPKKVRLRTNLEVYWDQIQWARGLPNTPLQMTRIDPETADLHYRGYSVVNQANPSSPEIPDYNRVASTTQIWRDLQGYYTRYGDVRPLLNRIDDRYVIMNAGDEMTMRFAAPAAPQAGWVRDYVIAGDGWIKDGDYNSTYSATVQPLPYHARTEYDTPPGPLADEWVVRHYPEDWLQWQTRYVTAEPFREALGSEGGSSR